MEIEHIPGATRVLAKNQPEYIPLAIRDEGHDGQNYMVSQWSPSPEELAALMLGAPIHLSIMGTIHPPVLISVGEAPASAATMDVDGGTGPSQQVYAWRVWTPNEPQRGILDVTAPNYMAALSKALDEWPDLKVADLDAERI